jgi:opacity protein-like surface antigen
MKKIFTLFLALVILLCFADEGIAAIPGKTLSNTGLSKAPDSYELAKSKKKRRKSKRKGGKGKGKGKEMQAAVGGGLFLGLPAGDFGTAYKMGLGLDIEGEYFLAPTFSAGLSTGYFSFKFKSDSITSGNAKVTPFLLKGNIYLSEGAFKPYIGLGVGMFYAHSKITVTIPTLIQNMVTGEDELFLLRTQFDDKETKLGLAPNVGFLYGITDNLNVMFNAKYNMMLSKETFGLPKNLSFIGINLGVMLSF